MTIHPRHNPSPAIAVARDMLRIPHAITANATPMANESQGRLNSGEAHPDDYGWCQIDLDSFA